jgi:hypothetical protein
MSTGGKFLVLIDKISRQYGKLLSLFRLRNSIREPCTDRSLGKAMGRERDAPASLFTSS